MKKILIILTVLVLGLIAIFYNNYDNNKVVLTNNSNQKIINSNTLTMMYETDYDSGEYQVSSDTSWPESGYTFNETLSKCENGGVLSWDDENKKVLLQTNTSDKCYVYFDLIPPIIFSEYLIEKIYTGVDGENDLYYHDGQGNYTNANQEAGDNSYRYSGANPNNYVCFGSDEEICPEENLYRIIGIFDIDKKIKLIKNSSFENVTWDTSDAALPATWGSSSINTFLDNYLIQLPEKWQDKILNSTWKISWAVNNYNYYENVVKVLYSYELGDNYHGFEYVGKVAVMYASDYGYAVSPYYWNVDLWDSNDNDYSITDVKNSNWLYLGKDEWTITSFSGDSSGPYFALYVQDIGSVSYTGYDAALNVRPTFYLNSDVAYISGTGTQTDPYRIA